jgi:hypothetical protein
LPYPDKDAAKIVPLLPDCCSQARAEKSSFQSTCIKSGGVFNHSYDNRYKAAVPQKLSFSCFMPVKSMDMSNFYFIFISRAQNQRQLIITQTRTGLAITNHSLLDGQKSDFIIEFLTLNKKLKTVSD